MADGCACLVEEIVPEMPQLKAVNTVQIDNGNATKTYDPGA